MWTIKRREARGVDSGRGVDTRYGVDSRHGVDGERVDVVDDDVDKMSACNVPTPDTNKNNQKNS